MGLILDVLSVVMNQLEHENVFCTFAFQFKTGLKLLIEKIEDAVDPIKEKGVVMSNDQLTPKRTMFKST